MIISDIRMKDRYTLIRQISILKYIYLFMNNFSARAGNCIKNLGYI